MIYRAGQSSASAADGVRLGFMSHRVWNAVGVKELTAESAISEGGWHPEHAVVLAIATHGDLGAALIDSNGDGADIDLDLYERDGSGDWSETGSSGVGDVGPVWNYRTVATWGRGAPGELVNVAYLTHRATVTVASTGWWLFIAPPEDEATYPVRSDPTQ
jgi:hypothetical protein